MKSAYELAMERLRKEDPDEQVSLTQDQKEELADIDQKYKAKIAEKEIFLKGKLQEAMQNQDFESATQLETQLKNERLRLQDECESKKNQIRNSDKWRLI